MAIRIAINGMGRIGRTAFKVASSRKGVEVVGVNDLQDLKTIVHLIKNDSVYGKWEHKVDAGKDEIVVNGSPIKYFQESDPQKIPWEDLDVDVVLECTGVFRRKEQAEEHLKGGGKLVIMSAPPKSDNIRIFLMGCNEKEFMPGKHKIISNASCTTNCIGPVMKVLNDDFGIDQALVTTIHSYTSSQTLVDGPSKGLRESRAAALNIIPSTTGAAIATTKVLTELENRFDGMAVRVPSPVVSLIDLVVHVRQKVSVEKVNNSFIAAENTSLRGILSTTTEPLVSTDFRGNKCSAVVDLPLTMVMGNELVKVLAWYDNEWGYSERLVDLAVYTGSRLEE